MKLQQREHNWPEKRHYKMPIPMLIQEAAFEVRPVVMPEKIVQYIFEVIRHFKLSIASAQLALSIMSRFLRKKANHLSLQLVSLVSILLAAKAVQINQPTIIDLHHWSAHSFTTKDFYRTQQEILKQLDFSILEEGVPQRQIKLVAQAIKPLIDPQAVGIIEAILEDIQKIVWFYLYTGKVKLIENQQKAVCATVVQLMMIMLTQLSGTFPQTLYACELTEAEHRIVLNLSSAIFNELKGQSHNNPFKTWQ